MDRKRIIVGVSGGIAAYKACTVVRQLSEAGHQVRVIPTDEDLVIARHTRRLIQEGALHGVHV